MKERTHRRDPSTVRSAALRSSAFRGWNTNSIGLRSGEYCDKYRSFYPPLVHIDMRATSAGASRFLRRLKDDKTVSRDRSPVAKYRIRHSR
jgi:hypothetical protein